jgi:hypothetical protein
LVEVPLTDGGVRCTTGFSRSLRHLIPWRDTAKRVVYVDMDSVLVDFQSGLSQTLDDESPSFPDWPSVVKYLRGATDPAGVVLQVFDGVSDQPAPACRDCGRGLPSPDKEPAVAWVFHKTRVIVAMCSACLVMRSRPTLLAAVPEGLRQPGGEWE